MKILHLESSSRNCSVAISDEENLLCLCEEVSENYKQSESLHIFVQWALEGAGISLQELDADCLGMGPGSYTGLRIGAAAAKGFCFGLGIPLVAVNSLDTLAIPFVGKGFDLIIPMVDARRMEVYCRAYDGRTGLPLNETTALILDENSFSEFQGRNVLFVGDGAQKARDILEITANFETSVFPSAQFLIRGATEKFRQKSFEDIAYFEPFYMKDFQGVKQKKNGA